MSRIYFNKYTTTLAADFSIADMTITLAANIPTIGASNYVLLTLDNGTDTEIIKISSNTGAPTYTVTTKAMEGTTSINWVIGDIVECRFTAATTTQVDTDQLIVGTAKLVTAADITKLSNLSGTNTGDQTITLTGHITGSGTGSFATTISTPSSVTIAGTDKIMFKDTSNSDAYAVGLASDIANLGFNPDSSVGTNNVKAGTGAGAALASGGDNNTLIGYNAGLNITTSDNNTAIGWHALDAVTTGATVNSTAIGSDAMGAQTSGIYNIGIGYQAGLGTTTTNHNVFIGTVAGDQTTATNSVIVGSIACSGAAMTVTDQVVIGYQAGGSGNKNVHIGYQTGLGSTKDDQVAIGYKALSGRTGTGNVGIGREAGKYTGTGANNTFLGNTTGTASTTGDNNTVIGYNADKSAATVSNEFTLGNSSIATLRCQQTSITALSDRRDKKDIEDLQLGLEFLNTLHPVKFTWNMRDGGRVGELEAGFIAQELKQASVDASAEWVGLVLDTNPERLEASPGKLIPILVKAIQELSQQIKELQEQRNK